MVCPGGGSCDGYSLRSQSIQTLCIPIACAPATSPTGSSPTYQVCAGSVPNVRTSASNARGAGLRAPISLLTKTGPRNPARCALCT